MPYITTEAREAVERPIGMFFEPSREPRTVGEVNYLITRLVDEYISQFGVSYTNVNAMIGVLECAKLELYRRIAAPYEDKKKEENGDVYSNA